MIWFGPAGNSESFYAQGYDHSWQMPEWLKKMGLNAYEYQCNKGVNLKEETARKIGEAALENGIRLSIHAPYYINLSSTEPEKRKNSIRYLMESLQAARWMGASRVVFHPGYVSGITRETAVEMAKDTLLNAIEEAEGGAFGDITLCPEVLGKSNQLGNLEEVMSLCDLDKRLIPCVDFGHVHALTRGGMNTEEDFRKILQTVGEALGPERLKKLHIHFSRVEFDKHGEKKHWGLSDTQYGPEFEPLARVLSDLSMEPVIICESRQNMAEDALTLKGIYQGLTE